MSSIRIFLIDDHALFRAGLRSLLQVTRGMEIVGEAANGRDALLGITGAQPDVVLADISMAELNGIDAIPLIHQTAPRSRVIILSMHATRAYVLRALDAGAAGYCVKDAGPGELEEAIRGVHAGGTYLSPRIAGFVIDELRNRMSLPDIARNAARSTLDDLTLRQREVLQLIAEGCSTKEIAAKLSVSVKTIDVHRTELMRRLDLHDIASLVRFAVRTGLIDP